MPRAQHETTALPLNRVFYVPNAHTVPVLNQQCKVDVNDCHISLPTGLMTALKATSSFQFDGCLDSYHSNESSALPLTYT